MFKKALKTSGVPNPNFANEKPQNDVTKSTLRVIVKSTNRCQSSENV